MTSRSLWDSGKRQSLEVRILEPDGNHTYSGITAAHLSDLRKLSVNDDSICTNRTSSVLELTDDLA